MTFLGRISKRSFLDQGSDSLRHRYTVVDIEQSIRHLSDLIAADQALLHVLADVGHFLEFGLLNTGYNLEDPILKYATRFFNNLRTRFTLRTVELFLKICFLLKKNFHWIKKSTMWRHKNKELSISFLAVFIFSCCFAPRERAGELWKMA